MKFPHGIIPAVPAIFDSADRILPSEVTDVISFLRKSRCEGIALNLVGGEFYKLKEDEKTEMIRVGLEAAGGDMIVCSGISAPGTTEACHLARVAGDLGVDCLMVMPPYYNPLGAYSRRAIIDHFRSVARSTDLPFVIQDFNYGIPLEILVQLRKEFSNFAGLKIEGAQTRQIERRIRSVRNALDHEFSILGGMLGKNLPGEVASGSSGSIPGSSLADLLVKEFQRAENAGDIHGYENELLGIVLNAESRRMKYFVYLEKAILKHRGIIRHTDCRKPYDYPGRRLMERVLADVDAVLSAD
jgi:4-hydroxy-tetrahydrodipicolinate synthase